MKKLEKYETPETDEEVDRRWNLLRTTSVGNEFARDLERKLAMCRDALLFYANHDATDDDGHKAEETLKATEPK